MNNRLAAAIILAALAASCSQENTSPSTTNVGGASAPRGAETPRPQQARPSTTVASAPTPQRPRFKEFAPPRKAHGPAPYASVRTKPQAVGGASEPRGAQTPRPQQPAAAAAPLRKAPDFTLRDHQGKTVSLKDFSPGRIVVLVWLNWRSPVCQRHLERENFQWLYDYYTSDDVAWLGINSTPDATPQENAAAVETHNLEFPILDDRRGDVARLYGARTTPHLFVVNAKGEIAYQGAFDDDPTGEKDLDSVNYVEEAIENLLAEEPVERPVSQPYGDKVF